MWHGNIDLRWPWLSLESLGGMSLRGAKCVAVVLGCVAILNFLSFVAAAAVLGGDAVNGKTDGQKYYLSSHGHFTEVSRSVFEYSRFHAYSVWVTHPLAFIGGYIYMRAQK